LLIFSFFLCISLLLGDWGFAASVAARQAHLGTTALNLSGSHLDNDGSAATVRAHNFPTWQTPDQQPNVPAKH
jgi:hypothetical protein